MPRLAGWKCMTSIWASSQKIADESDEDDRGTGNVDAHEQTLFSRPDQGRHYSPQSFSRFAGYRQQLRVIPHDAEHLRRVDN